jgi:hypothetical protein
VAIEGSSEKANKQKSNKKIKETTIVTKFYSSKIGKTLNYLKCEGKGLIKYSKTCLCNLIGGFAPTPKPKN